LGFQKDVLTIEQIKIKKTSTWEHWWIIPIKLSFQRQVFLFFILKGLTVLRLLSSFFRATSILLPDCRMRAVS